LSFGYVLPFAANGQIISGWLRTNTSHYLSSQIFGVPS
jgi:hypothetical protein